MKIFKLYMILIIDEYNNFIYSFQCIIYIVYNDYYTFESSYFLNKIKKNYCKN